MLLYLEIHFEFRLDLQVAFKRKWGLPLIITITSLNALGRFSLNSQLSDVQRNESYGPGPTPHPMVKDLSYMRTCDTSWDRLWLMTPQESEIDL
jgi:hypothetical protein